MAGLTSTGFEAKSLADIQAEIQTAIHDAISPTLNLESTSLLGQFVGSTASQIRQAWEASQANYAARDIEQATGDALTGLCVLTGTLRRAATYSTVLMTCTLAAGTYPAGSLIVYPVGSPADLFDNDVEIVSVGAVETGLAFTAQEAGPVRAEPDTLTVIANPVSGFTDPTNPASATLGLIEEIDSALRVRQATELARRGSTTVDAIRTDLVDALPTAIFVTVFENDTDATVDGIPPHAIECLVASGETDAAIGAAIFAAKPAGIRAYGAITTTVTDTQGNDHTIGFTEPTDITIYIDLALTVKSGQYLGDASVKTSITTWCDANLGVGVNVLKARIEALALSVTGVIDAAAEIGLSAGAGTAAANYVILSRQRALVSDAAGRINITQTVVSGPP